MPMQRCCLSRQRQGQTAVEAFDTIDAVIENRYAYGQYRVVSMRSSAVRLLPSKQPPSDKGRRLRLYYITL